MKALKYLALAASLFIVSCGDDKDTVTNPPITVDGKPIVIMNEGIWGQANASLTAIDPTTWEAEQYWYRNSNPGLELGDLANAMMRVEDTLWVAMTTSKYIEKIEMESGKSIGRLIFDAPAEGLKEIVYVNHDLAFVTDIFAHSMHAFNPNTMEIIQYDIKTGPAPEEITYLNGYVYVVNSGYGDFLKDKEKAGTVSVFDVNTLVEVNNFEVPHNPMRAIASAKRNTLFFGSTDYPSADPAQPKVIEYSPDSETVTGEWDVHPVEMELSSTEDSLFIIDKSNLYLIDLASSDRKLIKLWSIGDSRANLHGLGVLSELDAIAVSNAKDYQNKGEVYFFKSGNFSSPVTTVPTGLNPSEILR